MKLKKIKNLIIPAICSLSISFGIMLPACEAVSDKIYMSTSLSFFNDGVSGTSSEGVYMYYMDTTATLVLSGEFTKDETIERANALLEEITNTLYGLEKSISCALETSYITKFNEAEPGEEVELDETTYDVLSLAYKMYEKTNGAYNPGVYYCEDLYSFAPRYIDGAMPYDRDTYEILPDEAYVSAFLDLSKSFKDITLTEKNGKYYAKKPLEGYIFVENEKYNLKIDLGGIGKGYAADLVDELISLHGFDYGYFSFGSSSLAVKKNVSDKNNEWVLGFTNPRGSSSYITCQISDICLSTSGDYEQYYIIDDVRYCHIIDPKTGSPIQTGIISASVLGGSASEDDVYSTALMTMSLLDAVDYINENLSDLLVVMAYEAGDDLYVISNDPDRFYIVDSSYSFYNTIKDGKIYLEDV